MNKLQKEQTEKLTACGFEFVNDGDAYEPYQDFYRYANLTKTENLREGITFNKETGEFYASLEIQSDFGGNIREYGTSDEAEEDEIKTLSEALAWLEAAKKDFQLEIESVIKQSKQIAVSV